MPHLALHPEDAPALAPAALCQRSDDHHHHHVYYHYHHCYVRGHKIVISIIIRDLNFFIIVVLVATSFSLILSRYLAVILFDYFQLAENITQFKI